MRNDEDTDLDLSALRTPVPLRDADYAAVRARVMSKVAEPRRGFLRFAFAAAILALIGSLFWIRRTDHPERRAGVSPAAVGRPARLPSVAGRDAPRLRAGRPLSTTVARVAHRKTRPTPQPEMRIEIQTADPDIRIIWIANAQPKFLKEES